MVTAQGRIAGQVESDEFEWLEAIRGEQALAWVDDQNTRTAAFLDTTGFASTTARILEVLDSDERIPVVQKHGDFFYNFWKDAEHPRGIWRRTTLDEYRKDAPAWEMLLDLDDLGRSERIGWVWAGAAMRYPDHAHALLHLSPEGGDASALREFDLERKEFVEDGFVLPVAKTSAASWIDPDTVLVATDTGPESLTTSTYPRTVRRWRRGEVIGDAEAMLDVPPEHMMAFAWHDHTVGFGRDVFVDAIDFYRRHTWISRAGDLERLDVPDDLEITLHREWLLLRPRYDWTVEGATHVAGSLLGASLDAFLAGDRSLDVLFTPDERSSLTSLTCTRHHILLTILDDVSSRVEMLSPDGSTWSRHDLSGPPALHSVQVAAVDADENDDYWMTSSGFLTPTTLALGTVGGGSPDIIKSMPSFFDAAELSVTQHFARSIDGTRVPYFQIGRRDLILDGSNPTLLYGYGGFEISLLPSYNGAAGRSWLERGGVYVVANIRGGGEYRPAWHTVALGRNRHRAYEDFAAVARDLLDRGVTSPSRLGCEGGSNGGLLVGNMLTTYPELFGAIACEVPLLDMRRFVRFCAGASWTAEYGDPTDPEQWEFIKTFSPYHNLVAGTRYPPVLFYTATSDDRVGPEQARKMSAKMQAVGLSDVWFYENREGGHGAAADNRQVAELRAAAAEFLWHHLARPRQGAPV